MSCIPSLFIGVLLCLFAAPATRAETPMPDVRKVIAAVPADFPPTFFKDPKSGRPNGFAIDVMNELARRAGIEVEYVFGQPWDEIQAMLLSGSADIIPNLTIDEKRKTQFIFTKSVETLPASFIVRSDGQFAGLKGGMRVGVMKGSVSENHLRDRRDIKLEPYDSLQRLLFDLLAGNIDITMAPTPNLMKLAMDSGVEGHIRVLEPPVLEGIRAIALRPGETELLGRLNRAIDQFVGTPEYKEIYTRWWGKPKPFWTTRKVAAAVGVALLFSVLVMGGWRHATVLRLNRELRNTLEQLEKSRQELLQSRERSLSLVREAEQERARSQAILDGIHDGISIQDREYRILYQNSYFIEMVGVHLGEFCYRAYQQQDAICEGCPVEKTFRDAVSSTAVRKLNRQSGPYYVEVHTSPLRDEQGGVFAVIESIRDITERKRMEEALHEQAARLEKEVAVRQQAQEALAVKQLQLEEINDLLASGINEAVTELRRKDQMLIQQNRLAAMGEMINNIAHQWRQPLNNMGLIVQNLHLSYEAGDLTIAEMDREVGKAMDVIMHMSRTIDDFRNFFRPDKKKCGFMVNKVVTDALDFVAASIENSNIRVEVTADAEVGAFGYPNEYAQVLLNILSNAREALIEKAVANRLISIRVTRENNRSVVTIRDNGGGIPEGFLPKIFDPYFTTKEPGKGTGIGLYMSKVIIEQHMGGILSARNVVRGAEFRIDL